MFSNHIGDHILNAKLEVSAPKLFYSVTRKSSDGTVYLKLVDASSAAQPVHIQLNGAKAVAGGKLISCQPKPQQPPTASPSSPRLYPWKVGCTTRPPTSPTPFPASPFEYWS